jgi:hypothetical protein
MTHTSPADVTKPREIRWASVSVTARSWGATPASTAAAGVDLLDEAELVLSRLAGGDRPDNSSWYNSRHQWADG